MIDSSKVPLFMQFETSSSASYWIMALPAGARQDYRPVEMDNGKWTVTASEENAD